VQHCVKHLPTYTYQTYLIELCVWPEHDKL